jgi:hypothetical protein
LTFFVLALGAQSWSGLFIDGFSVLLGNGGTPGCGFTECKRKKNCEQKSDGCAVLAFYGTLRGAKNDEQNYERIFGIRSGENDALRRFNGSYELDS